VATLQGFQDHFGADLLLKLKATILPFGLIWCTSQAVKRSLAAEPQCWL
jgi:hypothetical protein